MHIMQQRLDQAGNLLAWFVAAYCSVLSHYNHSCNSPEDQDFGPEEILSEKKKKKKKISFSILHFPLYTYSVSCKHKQHEWILILRFYIGRLVTKRMTKQATHCRNSAQGENVWNPHISTPKVKCKAHPTYFLHITIM